MATDVHQHVWGGAFIDALRRRTTAPRLDGWTLHLTGEPPFAVDPADHDLAARAALAESDGFSRVLTSLSSPLGVEWLPPEDAAPLLAAYHEDALALPAPFGAWAAGWLIQNEGARYGLAVAAASAVLVFVLAVATVPLLKRGTDREGEGEGPREPASDLYVENPPVPPLT